MTCSVQWTIPDSGSVIYCLFLRPVYLVKAPMLKLCSELNLFFEARNKRQPMLKCKGVDPTLRAVLTNQSIDAMFRYKIELDEVCRSTMFRR